MVVGWTDGSTNYGTYGLKGQNFSAFIGDPALYGKNNGASGTWSNTAKNKGIGITTDSSKSGVVADLSDAQINSAKLGAWFIKF